MDEAEEITDGEVFEDREVGYWWDWLGKCSRCGSSPVVEMDFDSYERLCARCIK
jgi:hypothetical protein